MLSEILLTVALAEILAIVSAAAIFGFVKLRRRRFRRQMLKIVEIVDERLLRKRIRRSLRSSTPEPKAKELDQMSLDVSDSLDRLLRLSQRKEPEFEKISAHLVELAHGYSPYAILSRGELVRFVQEAGASGLVDQCIQRELNRLYRLKLALDALEASPGEETLRVARLRTGGSARFAAKILRYLSKSGSPGARKAAEEELARNSLAKA